MNMLLHNAVIVVYSHIYSRCMHMLLAFLVTMSWNLCWTVQP